jgi:hypothetical protein
MSFFTIRAAPSEIEWPVGVAAVEQTDVHGRHLLVSIVVRRAEIARAKQPEHRAVVSTSAGCARADGASVAARSSQALAHVPHGRPVLPSHGSS